ncbi:MAG: tRNA (guanosine(46)-N7)-methyltransferase TrmB [Pseudomonadota bacterium]
MYKERIRSYVKREGRITRGQKRALTELWPIYGLELEQKILDPSILFEEKNPICMEIGFGNGEALIEMALQNNKLNFLGVEVYRPGIGQTLKLLEKHKIKNVKIVAGDGHMVLKENILENTLQNLLIFFPDPWPKKKHHKRRLIKESFIKLAGQKIKVGGNLHIATDWSPYAKNINIIMNDISDFISIKNFTHLRPTTRYERRGKNLGHEIFDLVFEKN